MSVEKKTNYFDFTLEPGIYKFAIICGDDYTNYKHELIISKATAKATKKSKSSSSSSKQMLKNRINAFFENIVLHDIF